MPFKNSSSWFSLNLNNFELLFFPQACLKPPSPFSLPLLECLPQNYLNSLEQAGSAACVGSRGWLWSAWTGSSLFSFDALSIPCSAWGWLHTLGNSLTQSMWLSGGCPLTGARLKFQEEGLTRPSFLLASVEFLLLNQLSSRDAGKVLTLWFGVIETTFRPVSGLHGWFHLNLTTTACIRFNFFPPIQETEA